MIRIIYSFFVGILLSVFIGVGISLIYEAPEAPSEPAFWQTMYKETELTTEQQTEQASFTESQDIYQEAMNDYNRNVSIVALAFAVILLAIAVVYLQKMDVLANSLLLGGIFTLLYSLGRGLGSGDELFIFVIVALSLAAAIGLGYWKFVKPQSEDSAKK